MYGGGVNKQSCGKEMYKSIDIRKEGIKVVDCSSQ